MCIKDLDQAEGKGVLARTLGSAELALEADLPTVSSRWDSGGKNGSGLREVSDTLWERQQDRDLNSKSQNQGQR